MSSPPEREYISSLEALYGGKTSSEWWRDAVADLKKAQAAKAAAPAKKQHGYRDVVVRARLHRERDAFVESIKEEDIRRLASSYHGNYSCVLFKPLIRGSFNVCYFVEFANGDRWVVRVPSRPTLAIDPADKLETEAAVMRLLAAKTTIPVPKVHFAALGDGPAPFPSFLILEYIDGQKLDYKQLRGLATTKGSSEAVHSTVKDEPQAKEYPCHLHVFREYVQGWLDRSKSKATKERVAIMAAKMSNVPENALP
ncbi:hypothetical protein B0J18DRAFT_491384 [Chaetomium sp. MPI-SDFR-AT-0129]|nr:hypothetical protein B0J18DRAFT_491384 [Chaetomium sp. MPI-SDFR-AT-0129]